MLQWLLTRVQQKERPVSQNQQYSAELLAILLQSSVKIREKFIGLDGVDVLLQLLSQYRKRDPEKDSDEEEYAENLFDCLICIVDEDAGKEKFLEGEGVELSQIMLKEGKFSKQRGLRVLDHALGGLGGAPACERLVEAAGLKTVFSMFMKKVGMVCYLGTVEIGLTAKQQENQVIEHLLGIFASLLRLLPGGSAARIRTLAKFMEKDYEKIEKLVKMRRDYASKVTPVEEAIAKERKNYTEEEQEIMATEWLSRRFDAGLFSVQVCVEGTHLFLHWSQSADIALKLIDVILAWLVAEDDGAKRKIVSLLADRDETLSLIHSTLKGKSSPSRLISFLPSLDSLTATEQTEGLVEDEPGQKDHKEMLETLLQFL